MIRTCIKRSKSAVDYCPNIINSEKYKQEKNQKPNIEVTLVMTAKFFVTCMGIEPI